MLKRSNSIRVRPIAVLTLLTCLVGACTSVPEREASQPAPPPVTKPSGSADDAETSIDLLGLQRHLNLERPLQTLGLEERAFNTCRVGYGYSSSRNCRTLNFVVINFRLQCRDSEGTVSNAVGTANLTALAGRDIRWVLGGVNGVVRSDGEGFAQIVAILPKSAKTQRLRLAAGTQFLYMQAGEITRVVTPRPWCEPG